MPTVYRTLEEACAALGVSPREPRPGAWTAANLVDDPRGKGDGRIKAFRETRGGFVMNWKTREGACWFESSPRKLSPGELRAARALAQARALRRQAEEEEVQQKAARLARLLYRESQDAVAHPYFARKGVRAVPGVHAESADHIRKVFRLWYGRGEEPLLWSAKRREPMRGTLLLVPLYEGGDFSKMMSLQFIDAFGSKNFLKNAKTRGCFWVPESLRSAGPRRMAVAEGLVTAMSITEVLGIPAAAAMSCGNLCPAALAIRAASPALDLTVMGDRGNGEDEARLAAREARARLSIPSFTPELERAFERRTGSAHPTDFNDLFLAQGRLTPERSRRSPEKTRLPDERRSPFLG